MRGIDKYLIISSVFSIFTEDFYFHYIIDWKLFYIIIIINFLILAWKYKFTVHKNFIILIAFFLIHGVVSYLIFYNPIKSLVAQLLGISICSIYFYNLIKIYTVKVLVKKYLIIAFIIASLAIPMFYFNINVFTYNRLNGILSEPAHYAAIMLPAVYLFFIEKKYFKLGVIIITIMLSKSSIGYIGLLLMIIIPLMKFKHFLKYSLIAVLILSVSIFYISSKWNEKINENESNKVVRRIKETKESLNAVYTGKFKKYTNLSSYAVLSNAFITRQILLNKPLGSGLGSYHHEYDKYYEKMKPPQYLIKLNLSKINRTDASSLFLRLTADLGIFSIFLFSFFLFWSYKIFKKDKYKFNQSTFFYLAVKLIREGHYFPPEFYFFLLIFLKEFDEDTTYS